MKKILTILALVLAGTWAQATLTGGPDENGLYTYTESFAGGTILNGNPVGQTFSGVVSDAIAGGHVNTLSVDLDISGGYNGYLYAYLIAPNGTVVILMDPGLAPGQTPTAWSMATGDGMTIRFSDAGGTSIQSVTSGSYLGVVGHPESTVYSPASALSAIGGATVASPLEGSVANGTWQLFFSTEGDSDNGDATLNGWTLNLTVVPEPVALALGLFAAMLLALTGVKRFWTPAAKADAKREG